MKCVACSGAEVRSLLRISGLPVFCNQLCHTRAAALSAPRAEMDLVYCESCDHLFNASFDPEQLRYNPEYENSLHFSGRFQQFAERLAERLRNQFDLDGKTVVELGCGSGDFLRALCANPRTRGFGFDPSYPGDALANPPANVTIEARFFGPESSHLEPDLVCSRHVVEHIASPAAWLRELRQALGDGVAVYLEVPNSLYTLRDGGIWDLIYEHCGYFSPRSLSRLLLHTGFAVDHLEESFEGQFISVFGHTARGAQQAPVSASSAQDHVAAFQAHYESKLGEWRRLLAEMRTADKRVVIWGAGSKGNTFLNVIAADSNIQYAVDLNPRKQGKFVAGTGQEIVGPERLREYHPDVVIVMNPAYLQEIESQGRELGLSAQYLSA